MLEEQACSLLLANRCFLYALLTRGFAGEPDKTFLDVLEGDHARDELLLVADEHACSISANHDELCRHVSEAGDAAVAVIGYEYADALIGPGSLPAYPWETVCRSDKRVLFQREVLAVRESYQAAGYKAVRYGKEPDDFIGTELDFMAKLAEEAREAFEDGDAESCVERLNRSCDFLKEHLLQWIGLYANQLERNRPGSFYAAFARVAEGVLCRDRVVLDELTALLH